MSPGRERIAAALLAGFAVAAHAAEPVAKRSAALAMPGMHSDQPITVSARTLEYDYKQNVVVYRGDVQAAQGDVHLRSDELTIRLVTADGSKTPATGTSTDVAAPTTSLGGRLQLREIVAAGNVRIDQGARWATGGRAVFDQSRRILLLTDDPILHDGPNQIAGERVVVYLDEDRSVVEGGKKRVKAVLFPGRDGQRAPQPAEP
jgi:lipopolysaccharide export system protein LptA